MLQWGSSELPHELFFFLPRSSHVELPLIAFIWEIVYPELWFPFWLSGNIFETTDQCKT